MKDYISLYNEAMKRSTELFKPALLPAKVSIDTNKPEYDIAAIKAAIIQDFIEFIPSPQSMIGRCFKIVREGSYVLQSMGIPHYLTIGNIEYKGTPYFTTTVQSLYSEIKNGYTPFEPANAHAWLTLDSGQIVDLTILPSLDAQYGSGSLGWESAIFVSDSNVVPEIRHIPMLTGFGYHFHVVTSEFDIQNYDNYYQWLRDFPLFFACEA